MAVNTPELTRALEELIEALDRRVAHIERAGEAVIAREAAALRAKAVNRLAELTSALDVRPAAAEGAAPRRMDQN
jgi:hypothetical protein